MRMPLAAGWSSWSVNAFDAFTDIPLDKIAIYTPVAQTLYFNLAVIWST